MKASTASLPGQICGRRRSFSFSMRRVKNPSPAKRCVRTVAHGFEPWVSRVQRICEPVLTGERKLSFARQDALTMANRSDCPRLKAVSYGSYAGYADGGT